MQMVMDFLGTSLHQVKNLLTLELRSQDSIFCSGNAARFQLAMRGVVSILIFTLVCIYVANIGLSYAEAKERQSFNAPGMFQHVQT